MTKLGEMVVMNKLVKILGIFSVFTVMAGCSQVGDLKHAMSTFIHQEQVKTAGLFSSESSVSDELSWSDDSDASEKKIVLHFAYDNSTLSQSSKAKLDQLAVDLKAHSERSTQVAGHTDERGSREYNLALGWRRAKAVERYLEQIGVRFSQLDVMSYGKENPADFGHSARAWAHNRRVTIIRLQDHA